MTYTKEELLNYIVDTIRTNLQYDNLIDTCDIFGDELDITDNNGKRFVITIDIEESEEDK